MIPVNVPLITEEDIAAVSATLREGWISGEAPVVAEFEATFAEKHGQNCGIAVPNGSLALDLVFAALEIGPGDEVILPSFTIISCISELLRRGATPVFVDADPITWNMDVVQLETAISPLTAAIVVVHTYGLPVDMDPVITLAERYGIPIVEDSAEAHGLEYRGMPCGSMGYVSTFSFYANKNVTTGEGGMILTSDEALAEKMRYLRNLTFQPAKRFVHEDLGWNLRFTAIQAALGLSQLSRLDKTINRRREIAGIYRKHLTNVDGVTMAPAQMSFASNDYWVVGIKLDPSLYSGARELAERLAAAGVQTRPFFFPLHKQPVYLRSPQFHKQVLPVSEELGEFGLYLPNGLGLTNVEIQTAAETALRILSE